MEDHTGVFSVAGDLYMTSRVENADAGIWERDDVQFPRLLAEIAATQELNVDVLSEAMDLDEDAIDELLERAQQSWASAKNTLIGSR
jgi:hypothetical protein